jgi:hypothetical protein
VEKLGVNPKTNEMVIERMYGKVELNCGIFCHSCIKCLRLAMATLNCVVHVT